MDVKVMTPAVQKHLKQIEAGYPVNWKKIQRTLVKIGIPSALLNQAFDVLPYGSDTYQVTVRDDYAFTEIRTLLNKPRNNDRTSASVAGNSHAVSVKGAMLITWAAGEESPKVRVFNDDTQTQFPAKPNVLIIENEECFLNKEDTFQFVDKYCGTDCPITDIEFVFGSGNSISNKRILPYLKAATGQIYCLFDVDFGGLRIFSNLLAGGLSAERTHYLIPSDLELRLKQSKRIATQAELESLDQVYGISTKTDRIISAIRYYKTTLEQESYRAELG
ncbi:hypothetical protein [Rheinheimera gaetbuli]